MHFLPLFFSIGVFFRNWNSMKSKVGRRYAQRGVPCQGRMRGTATGECKSWLPSNSDICSLGWLDPPLNRVLPVNSALFILVPMVVV